MDSYMVGYYEAVFDEVKGMLDWVHENAPSGDGYIAAYALRYDYPGRTISGKPMPGALQLANMCEAMAFRSINVNDVTPHELLYDDDFLDLIGCDPVIELPHG